MFRGGPPTALWGPDQSPRPCLARLSHLNLQRGDAEAINGLLAQEAPEDKGDYGKHSGEVPLPPCGAQDRPRGPVSSCNPI